MVARNTPQSGSLGNYGDSALNCPSAQSAPAEARRARLTGHAQRNRSSCASPFASASIRDFGPRTRDQTGAHRIERHVAQGRREVRLVHRDRPEPALPEMPGAPPPRMNAARVAPMHAGQRPPQPVGVERHQDEMHVVGHQAPRPHLDVGLAAVLRQEIAVERVVLVGEEGARAAVATLRDMVRDAGDDDAGEAGHAT